MFDRFFEVVAPDREHNLVEANTATSPYYAQYVAQRAMNDFALVRHFNERFTRDFGDDALRMAVTNQTGNDEFALWVVGNKVSGVYAIFQASDDPNYETSYFAEYYRDGTIALWWSLWKRVDLRNIKQQRFAQRFGKKFGAMLKHRPHPSAKIFAR